MTYERRKPINWRKHLTEEEAAIVAEYDAHNKIIDKLRADVTLIRARATSRALRRR